MGIGVEFNGTRLDKSFGIGNIKRPMPEFKVSTTEIDGMDGMEFNGITVGMREFSFDLAVRNRTRQGVQDAARKLMELFSVAEPVTVVFGDEVDPNGNRLRRYALPTGRFDDDTFLSCGKWSCSFVQVDPYLYGKDRSVVLKPNVATKFSVGGNAEVYPMAYATVSGNSYKISKSSNDFLRYDGQFNGSSMNLILDFETQAVTRAPSGKGLTVDSKFFPIKGTETITATATTTLYWTERWL